MARKILSFVVCALMAVPVAAQRSWPHPWQGKRVAYLGDSVTDPRNKAAKTKYWAFLRDWLGITPYVYAVSGREWNDIPSTSGSTPWTAAAATTAWTPAPIAGA